MITLYPMHIKGYEQGIKINRTKIVDAYCLCRHGYFKRTAWIDGTQLCRHLIQAIRILKRRMETGRLKNE